jgi:hypothetical protein
VTEIQEYFQSLRRLEDWDEEDGTIIGTIFLNETVAEKHPDHGESRAGARMRELFGSHLALKQLSGKYGWFQELMTNVVRNRLRPAVDTKVEREREKAPPSNVFFRTNPPSALKVDLHNMSNKQAATIGGGLASCLIAHLTSQAGVDEWLLRYPAMKQLAENEVWFLPMIETMAQRILDDVA